MQIRLLKAALAILWVFIVTACQSTAYRASFEQFDHSLLNGDLSAAIAQSAHNTRSSNNALLWQLEQASLLRMQEDYARSNQLFEQAQSQLNEYDTQDGLTKTGNYLTAMTINDNYLEYRPSVYDSIMLNTYIALNYMALGDWDNTRIELNRVDERQARAAAYFSELIAKQKQHLARLSNKEKHLLEQSISESESILEKGGIKTGDWEAYEDYINPFSLYIHGLYFMLNAQQSSDLARAYTSLTRAADISKNPYIVQDAVLVKQLIQGQDQKTKGAWIIFENGLSQRKSEQRIELPVWIASDDLYYTGFALPYLIPRWQAAPYIEVNGQQSIEIASMNRIIRAEFNHDFSRILIDEMIRATLKTVAQKQLNDSHQIAGLAMGLYQAFTTSADLRMWQTLPDDFQLVRIEKPGSGRLEMTLPNSSVPIHLATDPDKNSIVYIRMLSQYDTPRINLVNF